MAATANFEVGADVNTAGNYTDAAMAYLQDEVKLGFIVGLDGETSIVALGIMCSCVSASVYHREVFPLTDANVSGSTLAQTASTLAFKV